MKKEIIQRILVILLMAAVLVYSFFNFHIGKINLLYLAVFVMILGYPLVGNILRLIEDLKNQ